MTLKLKGECLKRALTPRAVTVRIRQREKRRREDNRHAHNTHTTARSEGWNKPQITTTI